MTDLSCVLAAAPITAAPAPSGMRLPASTRPGEEGARPTAPALRQARGLAPRVAPHSRSLAVGTDAAWCGLRREPGAPTVVDAHEGQLDVHARETLPVDRGLAAGQQ